MRSCCATTKTTFPRNSRCLCHHVQRGHERFDNAGASLNGRKTVVEAGSSLRMSSQRQLQLLDADGDHLLCDPRLMPGDVGKYASTDSRQEQLVDDMRMGQIVPIRHWLRQPSGCCGFNHQRYVRKLLYLCHQFNLNIRSRWT